MTIGLSSMREVTEILHPPRALFCDFPLGRPLGKPLDPEYQHRVLKAAFALLEEPAGPVIHDFPDKIEQDPDNVGAACIMPPPDTSADHPAVSEAKALMPAYNRTFARTGRTNLGRTTDVAGIPGLVERFAALSEAASIADADLASDELIDLASDVRAFYEEASLALLEHVPGAGQTDTWFYLHTKTGAVMRAAWERVRDMPDRPADPLSWADLIPNEFRPTEP